MKEIKKKKLLKTKYKILIIIMLLISIFFIYARYIGTNGLAVKEYKITNSNLPTSFHGLKIVHISDIHYGRTINLKKLITVVNEINILKPDLVIFTGDLIDRDTKINNQITKDITNQLKRINSKLGKYAVYGNHDKKNSKYQAILNDSDFILLNNAYDTIYNESYEPIFIGGIDNMVNGNINLDKAMAYFDNNSTAKYKILLMHTPDYIDKVLDKYNIDLILAGHSHNGQIRLPFIGAVVKPYGSKKYYEPYYKINKTDIYISSGLGTSSFSLRTFNKPSFNFYRLTKNK